MNPNLSTSHVALQTDRSRLNAEAEHGWQAEQAGSSRWSLTTVTCRRLGAALIVTGKRLQQGPRGISLESPEAA